MKTDKIADITVKDIFEKLIGEDNARDVLVKIQEGYDKGLRGEELKVFMKRTIEEAPYAKLEDVSVLIRIGVAVSFGGTLSP